MKCETVKCVASMMTISLALWGWPAPAHGGQGEPVAECIEGFEPLLMDYGEHTSACVISPATDVDTFRFYGVKGDVVRVIVDGTSNDFDPYLDIWDCTGQPVGNTSCVGPWNGTCSCAVQITLGCTGEHTLILSDSGVNNTGYYTLQLERFPPPIAPPTICFNSSASDVLNPATDYDFLEFEGVAGTTVLVQVHGTTNDLDPLLEILDPLGQTIVNQYCTGPWNGTCSFNVQLNLELSGMYYLVVSEAGADNSGGYQLTLQCLFGNCGCLQRDFDEDGAVLIVDLLMLLGRWGQSNVPEDVNCDGIVDVVDFLLVLSSWGDCE